MAGNVENPRSDQTSKEKIVGAGLREVCIKTKAWAALTSRFTRRMKSTIGSPRATAR
ncbi:hypothetical protein B0G62_108125 [Paraburkholderia eburnea]|uniref:Uncharacterized protein n=1 Tax=Paraburkholderia eburnea TaxID=1189126 RepID=A0A2S4M7B6_9BURK|nr:hypothetical protein B0G62_108125 [Paraburkholderia eburnea]PRZ21401.1 hypothetical protein BX588_109125 [Paraburkholderia eburnea]